MDHDQFAGAIRQKTASQLTLNPPVCGPNTVVTVVTATEQDLGVYVGVYTCIYTFGVYTRVYWSKRSVYHKPASAKAVAYKATMETTATLPGTDFEEQHREVLKHAEH